jgi:hypothetical protein
VVGHRGFDRPRGRQRGLGLGERGEHAVGVDQQRVGQSGQLHQPAQVGIGSAQPGHLQAEHRPDLAQAKRGNDLPIALPLGPEPAGHAQIGVDDHDLLGQPPRRD